ncbi:hypothetical protein [Methylobacterium haplocladii]|uniref:Uncharacterized protein n=1 Tax=Methylobacterium haplocladii TaxID=1176176 RepID=A0A512IPX4_9HYPH|nr:hypothetical protein [Methylobacterium haplocladii]GEO99735.1 hypothetical protein MHA02_21230 [Methylobacterium haplocladii]GJD84632.1 hypothetical protein HPGCJGGD_2512 [Methylobacterium haplocladii]GLS61092.1 hypothetical protein GCM10007887_37860 [Methylobacterium haplocladii]
MKHALTAACLAAALAVAQAGPVAAETPSTPEAAPAPEAKGDPRVERQRNGAAKVAGMIRFVAVECPDAQPDYDRFRKVIAAMGVDIKDLEQGPLMVESLGYSEAYKKDTAGSCKRAFEHFGESGTTIPGLVARKAPDAKTP